MNSLPYTLNPEQYALFVNLQTSALLPQLAQPGAGELVELFKVAKKEEQRKTFEPYADILEAHILEKVRSKLPSILEQLKQHPGSVMTTELFTWQTVTYHESLTSLIKRQSAMTSEELRAYNVAAAERSQKIKNNRWESEVSIIDSVYDYYTERDEETYSLYPAKINKVFQTTDLAQRVALSLGPCFTPFIEWDLVEGLGEDGPTGFSVYKRTLSVRYHPFGMSHSQMMALLKVAKSKADRASADTIRMLFPSERLEITADLSAYDEYTGMPPLIPTANKHQCFCGCEDDDDE